MLTSNQASTGSILNGLWPAFALAVLTGLSQARAQSVTIAIDRNSTKPLAMQFSGANVSSSDSPEDFGDPAVQAFVRSLQPGILRWPGGTVDDFFDWKTGLIPPPNNGAAAGSNAEGSTPIDIERAVFGPFPSIAFNQQIARASDQAQPILVAKGGNSLGNATSGFAGLATAVGAKFLIVVNATTDTVEAAEQLASSVARRRLPVVGYELVNEPFFITIATSIGTFRLPPGSPKVLGAYKDGFDYLTRVKPYYDAIKRGYATAGLDPARAIVAIAGGYAADTSAWNVQWMQDLASYTYAHGAYWDAVAFHFYPPEAKKGDFSQAMVYANDALMTGTDPFIQGYRAASWSRGKPLFVSEYNVTLHDKAMDGSLYGGIFCAEYVARLSSFPEATKLLLQELFNSSDGIGVPASAIDGLGNWKSELTAAGRAGQTIDTVGRIKGMFYNVQILGLGLANATVNASDEVYGTALSGAVGSVATRSANLPAVYAQAYRGRNQSTHILITNKGADNKLVQIVIDGQSIPGPFSMDSIQPTAGDPSERNSASAQPIAISHAIIKGIVPIPGYSVSHLRLGSG